MRGVNRVYLPARYSEACDLHVAIESRAVALGLPRHSLGGPGGPGVYVGRDMERAQDAVGQHWDEVVRLAGTYDVGLDAPAHGEPGLALEVFQTLRRPGHFQAADRIGAPLAVEFHALPEFDSITRETRHGLGGIDLEDQAGRVGGGPACLEKRPLVQDHDVAPAEFREVIGHAATGDASADDYRSCLLRQGDIRHIGRLPRRIRDDIPYPNT